MSIMSQLTLGDIIDSIKKMQDSGYTKEEVRKMPVYLGDDDELNGIHCAWYCQPIDANDENDKDFTDLINGSYGNNKLTGKGYLIS